MRDDALDYVSVDEGDPNATDREQRDKDHCCSGGEIGRPGGDGLLGLEREIGAAMHGQHRDAHEAAQQRKGIEQTEEIALVGHAHCLIKAEGDALKDIAECDAEDQRRDQTADKQRPIPHLPPGWIGELRPVLEPGRPQDKRAQNQEHSEIEAGKGDRVEWRPCREDRAARG